MSKVAKEFANYEVVMKREDGIIEHLSVISVFDNTLETKNLLLNTQNADVFTNSHGGLTFLFNVTHESLTEAHSLKALRRNVALTRMFEYDKEKPVSWGTIGAFAVAIIAILF